MTTRNGDGKSNGNGKKQKQEQRQEKSKSKKQKQIPCGNDNQGRQRRRRWSGTALGGGGLMSGWTRIWRRIARAKRRMGFGWAEFCGVGDIAWLILWMGWSIP